MLLNKEASRVLSQDSVRGSTAVAGFVLLCQSMRREALPWMAARLGRQLAEAADLEDSSGGEDCLAILDSWEWKTLQYL